MRKQKLAWPLTAEFVRAALEKRERILRIQYDDEMLPEDDEAALKHLPAETDDGAWERYLYIVGCWHAWERGYRKRSDEGDLASRMLLDREPVPVRVAGRFLRVTSRSRAANIRIARHERTRRFLTEKIHHLTERIAHLDGQRKAGEVGWVRWRKDKGRLLKLTTKCEREFEHHTRGILANCLTENGRAALPEEAPEWWDQVTPEDEARLFWALMESGPLRFEKYTKSRKRAPKTGKDEDWGMDALLRAWEGRLRLPMMALDDVDLAQQLTALDIGAARGSAESEMEELVA